MCIFPVFFLEADVHVVPQYNEVRDEFEILDMD